MDGPRHKARKDPRWGIDWDLLWLPLLACGLGVGVTWLLLWSEPALQR